MSEIVGPISLTVDTITQQKTPFTSGTIGVSIANYSPYLLNVTVGTSSYSLAPGALSAIEMSSIVRAIDVEPIQLNGTVPTGSNTQMVLIWYQGPDDLPQLKAALLSPTVISPLNSTNSTSSGGNITIVEPVDGSGNVKTVIEGPLDGNGNVKVALEGPFDTAGNLKVTEEASFRNVVDTPVSNVWSGSATATALVPAPAALSGNRISTITMINTDIASHVATLVGVTSGIVYAQHDLQIGGASGDSVVIPLGYLVGEALETTYCNASITYHAEVLGS